MPHRTRMSEGRNNGPAHLPKESSGVRTPPSQGLKRLNSSTVQVNDEVAMNRSRCNTFSKDNDLVCNVVGES